MKIQPLGSRIVVRPLEQEETTPGGIIIPETAREKSLRGEVVSVGQGAPDKKGVRRAPDVKKGDRVLFDRWAGSKVELDGVEYLILREDEVLGVL